MASRRSPAAQYSNPAPNIRVDPRNLWETPAHPVINMDILDAA